jgi:hypothetical protein
VADISYSITMKVEKGFLSTSINALNVTATMNKVGMSSVVASLSTTPATVISTSSTSVSTAGICFLRNLATASSATASIGISAGGSFVPFVSLRGGETAIFRASPTTQYEAVGVSGTPLRVDVTEG